jgi:ferredoxin
MPKLEVSGYGSFEVPAGKRLVLALEDAGVDMLHRCGGKARCTTCLVEIEEGAPETMTEAERDILKTRGLYGQGRLSCQILCEADMALRPSRTVSSSGLEAGPRPADGLEPPPVLVPAV